MTPPSHSPYADAYERLEAARRAAPGAPSVLPIRVRARSFMALILTPTPPLDAWLAALDEHMQASPGFFAERPIIADLGAFAVAPEAAEAALDGMAARRLRLIGAEGLEPASLEGGRWGGLPTVLHGRGGALIEPSREDDKPAAAPPPAAPTGSLLIEGPVRSGQSIYFEDGDITVLGAVASGAEVVAGGSVHVYGALRGRAIAGVKTGTLGRVFCRKMEAELVGVDRLYRTAEHWGAGLHGRPVSVRADRGVIKLTALD